MVESKDNDLLKEQIIGRLQTIQDPEIPVNIYDLGLIYDIHIPEPGTVNIMMTLTTPNCPMAQTFPSIVETNVLTVPGITTVKVEIVWEPPWDREMMSEAAKLQLDMF